MCLRPALLAMILGVIAPAVACRADDPRPKSEPTSVWIIPHTHWEGAVFKTREEYLDVGLTNIVKALQLLKTYPDYRFVLDQVAYVRPFLERYPELEGEFRRYLQEGRLELTLGLDVMPDVNMPGGESFVRQLRYGKGYYRDKLGIDVKTGWLLDTFGAHAQIPQILRQAGMDSYWFMRGVPSMEHPSEFVWEGLDGTKIPAFWLTHTYAIMWGSPADLPAFRDFLSGRAAMLAKNQEGPELVGLAGVDVGDPEPHLPELVAAYNGQPDAPLHVRFAVPSEFEAVAKARGPRPILKGELNPIFQGIYSSRIELKHWMRDMERRLTAAETLGVLADWLGVRPADSKALTRAWEPVLFNETHDLASGVMTDHVYEDVIRGFEFSKQLADEQVETGLDDLASRIDTSGEGTAVVVFNPLGWVRSDAVEVTVGFAELGVAGLSVLDPEGQVVTAQMVEQVRYGDGGLRSARVAFVARDVPALGYGVFRVVASSTPGPPMASPSDGDALENSRYRVAIDKGTGALTSMTLKEDGWEVLAGPGNVVSREEDRGDLWEPYRGLDGGSRVAMTNVQAIPAADHAKLSTQYSADAGVLKVGPVYSEFRVAHPLDNGTIGSTVRLYAELPRIEFETALVNNEKYVRYQTQFPTTLQEGRNVHEIPFGASERPNGVEFPAQNWVDQSDGQHGLALLNIGLPGNVANGGTMMVSLLRSHNLGQYGFGGGYEPGMSSESGFQIGVERRMRYAAVPHTGDWKSAGIYRDGLEFNRPLLVRKAAAHGGSLPKRWGLIEVSDPQVVVSSLAPGRDGAPILRLYEATGQAAKGLTLKVNSRLKSADEVNLLDDPIRELPVEGGVIRVDLGPFEIRSIRLGLSESAR